MTDDVAPADHDAPEQDGEFDVAEALETLQAENAALRDQALRYAAEAENTKRRAEREANDARAFAIQKFARDLLGVADNLSRALQHAPREDADPAVKNFVLGIEMTDKELAQAFERNGLKKIDPAKGAKFDPHVHQAMMEQEAPDVEPGAVVQAVQVGFELYGRVVRPAMVVVAAKAAAARPQANGYAAADTDSGGSVDTKA
ncbi:MAG TPA: nucleotide exchange factor GrpE [Caulobacteraceae bacterium]|nr:nucleotide exchange factor GrpE [Caulobacteraceae bacterium]